MRSQKETQRAQNTDILPPNAASHSFQNPLFGGLFENMVVVEALKARHNAGQSGGLYFLRNQHGLEVDLIVERQGLKTQPVEIKGGRTFELSFAKNLRAFQSIVGASCVTPAVVYAGEMEVTRQGVHFANFKNTARIVR